MNGPNTRFSLQELGIDTAALEQVNIDGLVQSTFPEEVRGHIRMEINGSLVQILYQEGVLSMKGEKTETTITMPFEERILTGWRVFLVREGSGTIAFLEGDGHVEKDTLGKAPTFVLHNGTTSFPIPVESVSSITAPDIYFKNPDLIP